MRAADEPNETTSNRSFTGADVRQLRTDLEMSETKFAQLLGVAPASVKQWEKEPGKISFRPSTLSALRAAERLVSKPVAKKAASGRRKV